MELSAVWNFLSLTKNTRTFYRCKTSTVFLQQFFQRRKRARKQVLTTPTKNSLYSSLFAEYFPFFLASPTGFLLYGIIGALKKSFGTRSLFRFPSISGIRISKGDLWRKGLSSSLSPFLKFSRLNFEEKIMEKKKTVNFAFQSVLRLKESLSPSPLFFETRNKQSEFDFRASCGN